MTTVCKNVYYNDSTKSASLSKKSFVSYEEAVNERFAGISPKTAYVGTVKVTDVNIDDIVKSKNRAMVNATDLGLISNYLDDLYNIINSLPNSMTVSKKEKERLKKIRDSIHKKHHELIPLEYI